MFIEVTDGTHASGVLLTTLIILVRHAGGVRTVGDTLRQAERFICLVGMAELFRQPDYAAGSFTTAINGRLR